MFKMQSTIQRHNLEIHKIVTKNIKIAKLKLESELAS